MEYYITCTECKKERIRVSDNVSKLSNIMGWHKWKGGHICSNCVEKLEKSGKSIHTWEMSMDGGTYICKCGAWK